MARLRPPAPPLPVNPDDDEKPTHFVAVPIASPTAEFSDGHRRSMERGFTALNPAGTRVILARSPRAVLRPEDIRSPVDRRQLREVPEAERRRHHHDRHLDAALARCSLLDPPPATAPLKRRADEEEEEDDDDDEDGASAAPSAKRVARPGHAPARSGRLVPHQRPFRLITRLATHPDLIVRICRYLPADGVLALYSLTYDFYDAVNQWMRDACREWAEFNAPSARWVFDWRLPDYQHLASEAPEPWHSMLTPAVRKFLEKSREPQGTPEEANLKAYLESRGIDTSDRKGKEVSGTAVGGDDAGHASRSTATPNFEYRRVVPTIK